MATFQGRCVIVRMAFVNPHRFVPAIGDIRQPWVELGSQIFNQRRKRIGEIFVLSPSEAMPRHDDAAAKIRVVGIEACNRPAISRGSKLADNCKASRVQVLNNAMPIYSGNSLPYGVAQLCLSSCEVHDFASLSSKLRLRSAPHR